MTPGLLIPFGATVAGGAGDAVLAGALPTRLVARLPTGTYWVAVAGWRENNTLLKVARFLYKYFFLELYALMYVDLYPEHSLPVNLWGSVEIL